MKTAVIAVVAVLAAFATMVAASGGDLEPVCVGEPEHIADIVSTSISERDTSMDLSPAVAEEIATRAAASCGVVSTAIANNSPNADLELVTRDNAPALQEASNRNAVIDRLAGDILADIENDLIAPLHDTPATPGSPMLAALAKVGREGRAFDWGELTVVWVGDGLLVDRSPVTGTPVAFGHTAVSQEVLDEWVPSLRALRGSCVILVGAGAGSELPDELIEQAHEMLGRTLAKAGVGFVATRSANLPPSC